MHTVGIILILGFVCVLAVTAAFAAYYYATIESDMRYRARSATDFFAEYQSLNYDEFYQACLTYAQSFEDKNRMELQFIGADRTLAATSYSSWIGQSPRTPEIDEAFATQAITSFVGKMSIRENELLQYPALWSSAMVRSLAYCVMLLLHVSLIDRSFILH